MTVANGCSPSTRSRWAYVKIERAAGPGVQGERSEHRSASKASSKMSSDRDLRRRQTVQVKFRGGAECWWELTTIGRTIRVAGHEAVHDALTWLLAPQQSPRT